MSEFDIYNEPRDDFIRNKQFLKQFGKYCCNDIYEEKRGGVKGGEENE